MKRFISLLLVLLFVFGATACSSDNGEGSDNSENESSKEIPMEERPVYEIKYGTPYSNNTVNVTDIWVNHVNNHDIHVEIPATDEKGNKVIGISFRATELPIFRVLAKEDFENLTNAIKEKSESRRPPEIFKSYYMLLDLEDKYVSDDVKAEWLKSYPFIENGAFYVLDATTTCEELNKLSDILKNANISIDFLESLAKNTSKVLKDKDLEDELEFTIEASELFSLRENITQITFPETIEKINLPIGIEGFTNLRKVSGFSSNTMFYFDDLENFVELCDKYGCTPKLNLTTETAQWFATGDFGNFLKLVGETYLSEHAE